MSKRGVLSSIARTLGSAAGWGSEPAGVRAFSSTASTSGRPVSTHVEAHGFMLAIS